jgi:hypothetical protein
MSGWPVPTYFVWRCSQFLDNDRFTLNLSDVAYTCARAPRQSAFWRDRCTKKKLLNHHNLRRRLSQPMATATALVCRVLHAVPRRVHVYSPRSICVILLVQAELFRDFQLHVSNVYTGVDKAVADRSRSWLELFQRTEVWEQTRGTS